MTNQMRIGQKKKNFANMLQIAGDLYHGIPTIFLVAALIISGRICHISMPR
jgi:hypothetical protein